MQVSETNSSSCKTCSTKDICDWTKKQTSYSASQWYQPKTRQKIIKQNKTRKTLLVRYNKITKTHLMKIQIQTTPPSPHPPEVKKELQLSPEKILANKQCLLRLFIHPYIHSFQHQNSTKLWSWSSILSTYVLYLLTYTKIQPLRERAWMKR